MDDRLIAGRYKVLGLAGEGGLARVYSGVDNFTNSKVAIKEIKADSQAVIAAFEKEYRFASLNRHPTLIPPVSFLRDDKSIILIMPFIDGFDLKSFRNRALSDENLVENFIASILEVAAFIHFSGHIYNDFKPENILIVGSMKDERRGILRPVLLDYNLVSVIGENVSKRGTIEYAAPEILLGGNPSPRSDLYSIGVVIYELFSGDVPFFSDSTDKLIKLITEDGFIDYSKIPVKYREGLKSLLVRDVDQRPSDARAAAGVLGLESQFNSICASKIDHYLSAGPPPFHQDLIVSFDHYLKGMSCKIFSIRSLNHNRMAINYLAAEYEPKGFSSWRIEPDISPETALGYLKDIKSWRRDHPDGKAILFIDDIEILGEAGIQYLRNMTGHPNRLRVAAGYNRWAYPAIPSDIFDPLQNQTKNSATAISIRSYLKKENLDFNFADLTRCSGGDPPIVYSRLKNVFIHGGNDLLSKKIEDRIPVEVFPENKRGKKTSRILESLRADQIKMLEKLSVWGDSVPMLVLGAFDANEQSFFDEFLKSGHLFPGKDAVSFPSGDARDYIYEGLSVDDRKRYHGFWAEAAEDWLSESDDYIELAARHWGGSDNIRKGYKAIFTAAREFLNKGELSKAEYYAEKLQALANADGGSVVDAAGVYADILKEMGDYKSARVKYLELLRLVRADKNRLLEANTNKNLGDLYRSTRKTRKAFYYTNAALKLYMELSDDQGIADCNNNIGLTHWIDEQYERALESFSKALEANRKINNRRELAKIQSNQGIIKDITGKTREVADHFIKALNYASEAGDSRLEAIISNNLGYFYIRQGEYKEANKNLHQALAISEKIGYAEGIINSLSNQGLSYLRSGDLFMAVDFNQKALETAESLGSRHLAASAELYLAEACILMGNYTLAENVLSSIESGKAYDEDKSLKPQTKLLRSRLMIALGDVNSAYNYSESVLREAVFVGDTRLKLEAELSLAEGFLNEGKRDVQTRLLGAAERASDLGHGDLLSTAGIILASLYIESEDFFNAEGWLERVLSSPNLTRESFIRAKILAADIYRLGKKYDDALEILYEIEGIATVSGFVPLAFRASVILSEIFLACSKFPKLRETVERARSHKAKLFSALPETISSSALEQTWNMKRFAAVINKTVDKEFLRV